MDRIKLMIVDDHELVRLGLKTALEPEEDMEVVADSGDARVALEEAESKRPDVVLMDVRMPGMDGIEACRLIRDRLPETKVVMLTSYADEEAVMASILAGAVGYLLKDMGRPELLKAVREVARGQSLLDPAVTAQVMARIKRSMEKKEIEETARLSAREKEVLALVAEGLTNKEIAGRLIISEHTARNHVSHILDKLGLSRRSQAATFAAQHGLAKNESPERDRS